MARKNIAGVLVLVLMGLIISSPALAAQISVDQVNLKDVYDFSENPWEIIPDGTGGLVVSDDAGVIWQVNPNTGSYSLVDTAIVGLASARRAEGGYYFSDYQNTIGYADQNDIYLWEIPPEDEYQIDHAIGRLNLDSSGAVWFIEYETSDSKIYKFNRSGSNADVCTLIPLSGSLDYGTYAYDLDYHDGYLWWFNYYEERIVRLNTVPNASDDYLMEYWDVPEGTTLIGGRENAFDPDGNFWISGGGGGTLLQFDPVTEILTTYTVPDPGSPSIEGLTIVGSQVWYADIYGSVGILDPAGVSGTSTDLTSAYGSMFLSGASSCAYIPAVVVEVYATQSGTLGFADRSVAPDTSHPGWTIIPLTENDLLAGINTAQGVVLVSAPNDIPDDRKLIRFTSEIDIVPALRLVKTVTNDNGGSAVPNNWTLYATGSGGFSNLGGLGVFNPVLAGVGYVLSESTMPGYVAGSWSCDGGTQVGSTITLGPDDVVTCVINNNDIAPTLKLVKTVTNDNGGTAVPDDWTLTATGPNGFSNLGGSGTFTPVMAGVDYVLSESTLPGYLAGNWSCDGGILVGSTITLDLDEDVTCTINNDDYEFMVFLPLIVR